MADEEKFDFIFGNILREIKNEFAAEEEQMNLFCKRLEDDRDNICNHYKKTRDYVRKTYLEEIPDHPFILDRHKCVASFMIAFLEEFSIEEYNLNKEFFAIYVGMLILKIFMFEDCKHDKDHPFIKFITKNEGFKFPNCICDDEPYVRNWALGIYYGRESYRNCKNCTEHNGYSSVFALSNVLFLIENYNRMLCEKESFMLTGISQE